MKPLLKTVGILSSVGAVKEHKKILDALGVHSREVQKASDLDSIDALIIPGGSILPLEISFKALLPALKERIQDSMNVLFTGNALLLTRLLKIQKEISFLSFDIKKEITPYSEEISLTFSDTKPFLAHYIHHITLTKFHKIIPLSETLPSPIFEYQSLLFCTFYPELSDDYRIHEYFLTKI
jgi:5'-phosphate synthase pdxT subunit